MSAHIPTGNDGQSPPLCNPVLVEKKKRRRKRKYQSLTME
jgi:hypothetical protein